MKRELKIFTFLCIVLSFVFAFSNIYAEETPSITMTTNGDFYINEQQEFTISTVVPEGYETVTVVGEGSISDTSAIEKLEYYEVRDGNWYTLPEDTAFGGSTGFELTNATSRFRVTFKKAGKYSVRYAVKKVNTQQIIAENTLNITVMDRSISDVSTEDELRKALDNSDVKTINITKDITTSSKINIVRDVTINGNSHKLTLNIEDKNTWGGHYVLQAYRCNVTLMDITLTGGNAGLLVNGSSVTLKGTIDVSNNGFGGIELAKSSNNPSVKFEDVKLINTSEEYLKPTLWTDPVLEGVTVDYDGFANSIEVDKESKKQTQYYLVLGNTVDTIDNQLKKQMGEEKQTIELTSTGTDKISKELLNELRKSENRTIVIYQDDVMITFETKNITEDFKDDLDLRIDVTDKQPFKSDILKDVKGDKLFIELENDGILPKETEIMIKLNNFKPSEKTYLYYYDEKTDNVDLVSDKVKIKDDNWASIVLNHSSTYILSTEKIEKVGKNEGIINPNTSDTYMVVALVLGVVALAGFIYAMRLRKVNR